VSFAIFCSKNSLCPSVFPHTKPGAVSPEPKTLCDLCDLLFKKLFASFCFPSHETWRRKP
jgi:hypothetical protein